MTGESPFEHIKRRDTEGQEFWHSRELAEILGYSDYRNFVQAIERAKTSLKASGGATEDHFVDFTEKVEIGSGAQREVESTFLSRYACYLVVQNADPKKLMVALGQNYFAIQTRRQEIADQALIDGQKQRVMLRNEMKEHNKKLAAAAKDAGISDPKDYAIFQSHGYKGLYGGLGVDQIKAYKGLGKSQDLLNHMGSTELAANLFRATQTEEKIRKERIRGKANANAAHHQVGQKVRKTMMEISGIAPEDLAVEEDIRKVEKRLTKDLPPSTN
jgi:DNA-damage-inducible protein D